MNDRKGLITANELTCLLIGILIDINITMTPNSVVAISKQDGWISMALGAVYPLYVALIAIYVSRKFPNDNILVLSKRYFGSFIGNVLNFLFFISFFSYFPPAYFNATLILRTYIIPFMSPFKVYLVITLIGAYTAYKGLKVLARIGIISFFLLIVIMLVSLAILFYGSILNVMPIFGVGAKDIIYGSKNTVYDYALFEWIFLLYPFINDKNKIKDSAFKAIAFCCFVYTWVVFIAIYYLGIDMIKKTIWGFFSATESIRVDVITSFRYVFVFIWVLIALKSISYSYYICIDILRNINKNLNKKLNSIFVFIIMGSIVIFITKVYYPNRLVKDEIVNFTTKASTIYNLFFITLIAVIIIIKKDDKCEKI